MTTPIPTGRYSITVTGRPALVKLTRVTAPRRWTTISIASPLTPDGWVEVHHPGVRDRISRRDAHRRPGDCERPVHGPHRGLRVLRATCRWRSRWVPEPEVRGYVLHHACLEC